VSELQHPDARPFEAVAELYERVRPSYPDEAVAWLAERLAIGPGSTVLDLGAGTGKLTRQLVPRAGRVIAVEPGPEMLAQLRRAVPEADAFLGAAEAIPLPDAAVDAVVCGQSFHWFRTDEALREIHRVLRPRRGVGLIWNTRDPDDPLQNEITKLVDPFVPPGRPPLRAALAAFVGRTFSSEVATHTVPWEQELDADGVVDRVSSISFVVAAPAASRRELERDLSALVEARGGRVAFRYVTEVFVTFSVG
jgi:ubiquinone/menaquinone biosynthesis C-methylase UbiE